MDCVADTHASIWYLFAAPDLSGEAKDFMDSVVTSGGFIFIPAISIVEIIYLIEKSKLPPSTLSRIVQAVNLPNSSFSFKDINAEIAQSLSKIPRNAVPDMPDRIIAATAVYLNLPLVTKDNNIRAVKSIETI